jgi:hypothetical protein
LTSLSGAARHRIRMYLPYLVVAAVTTSLVLSAAAAYRTNDQTFAFSVYWPPPSSYYPGASPPNVYLVINYTGPGTGNYTYVIGYESASSFVVVAEGEVMVSNLSPFTAYASVPLPPNSSLVVQAEVYRGAAAPQDLVYSRSVTL